ncbi:tetratricopeptide repeat protein [Xanthobacter sp. V4C-4]|uniref:tetratricopeptide repeat protein n=1 Tax=Xanthobacter cornucopiae TaxID=3119924 RepID=UPI00372A0E0A
MRGRIVSLKNRVLRAWAWDPARPGVPLQVVVGVDGAASAPLPAQAQISADAKAGFPGGPHGVRHVLPLSLFPKDKEVVRTVVLQVLDDHGAAATLHERRMTFPLRATLLEAQVEKLRRGRCHGWAGYPFDPRRTVEVRLQRGDAVIASAMADQPVSDPEAGGLACGFELPVPAGLWAELQPGERLPVRTAEGEFIGSALVSADDIVWGLLNIARQSERSGGLGSAFAALDRALHWSPDHVEALWQRARLAAQAGDSAAAQALAARVRGLDPAHGAAINLMARLALAEGRRDEALALWEQIAPTASAYREAVLRRGQALRDMGRPWEAIPLARALLDARDDDVDAHLLLGRIYLELGQTGPARRHLAQVSAARPEDRKVADLLAAAAPPPPPPPVRAPELFAGGALRAWTAAAAGRLEAPGLLLPTLFLRPATGDGAVDYRIGALSFFQAGGPPSHDITLAARDGAAELGLRLRGDAGTAAGLRLSLEALAAAGADVTIEVGLGLGAAAAAVSPTATRRVAELAAGRRREILLFDLVPTPHEAAAVAAGTAWLVLRLAAGAAATLRAPWPVAPLPGAPVAGVPGPEGLDPAALAVLRQGSSPRRAGPGLSIAGRA